MYVLHLLMVVDLCVKYGMPMSNQKIVMGRTQKHVQKPYKYDLKVKVQGRIWIVNVRATHRLMVMRPCAKYV